LGGAGAGAAGTSPEVAAALGFAVLAGFGTVTSLLFSIGSDLLEQPVNATTRPSPSTTFFINTPS
jgi:hypothetical protein